MGSTISGRCACGAVTYQVSADPVLMINCHCRDCQRASGGAFAPVVVAPRGAVKMNGELRYHPVIGDDGYTVERGFCPTCGNPIAILLERKPDIVGLVAASLDDPSLHRPSIDVFTSSAPPWDHLGPDTQKFERGLPK